MKKFFKSSLIRKLALMSILNILCVCIIIITMGAVTLFRSLTSAIENEMQLSASAISSEIEQVFDSVILSTLDLSAAATAAFTHSDIYTPEENVFSIVQPNLNISLTMHDYEKYSTQSILNSLNHNSNLAGMGIFFEPDGFWPDVENYSIYVTSGMSESDIQHFLDYDDYRDLEYFLGSKSSKNMYLTAPYLEGNTMVVSVVEPILNNNNTFIGIVGADVAVGHFGTLLTTNDNYPTMNATILDHNLDIAYTTRVGSETGDSLSILVNNSSDMANIQQGIATNQAFQVKTQRAGEEPMTRFFDPIQVGDYSWWSVTSILDSDMNSATVDSVVSLTVMSCLLLAISVVAQLSYVQYTLKDIKKVVVAAEQIHAGSLDVDLHLTTGDEIQLLGDSFQAMANELRSMVKDIKYVLAEVSTKNLNVVPTASYVGDFQEIETSMVTIVGTMNVIMSEINSSSQQVAQGASNVTDGSMTLSHGATEQAESVESLSNRVTDVSDKITENAENSIKANDIFSTLVDDIQDGNEKIGAMIEAMADIADSSQQISKIMKTINDIASQTNILALNASVEAARAGEAGKGFAVVASEVKSLAQKSSEAAKSTTKLIKNSVEVVQRGSELATSVEESLASIIKHADNTKSIMLEITSASHEQAESIQDITSGIHTITDVVQNTSSAAVESAAASEELLAQSETLQTMVKEFKFKR